MNIRSLFFLVTLLSFAPIGAYADKTMTMAYSRANIVIARKSVQAQPTLPWQAKINTPDNTPVSFQVEVRDAAAMYNQQGWFNLSDMAADKGVLMVFNTPQIAPLTHTTQYAPLDILLADSEGKIIQIVPNIRLSELEQDIVPSSPVLAFLFLKGGTCASRSINPGDKIEYNIFRKPPVIVNQQVDKKQP